MAGGAGRHLSQCQAAETGATLALVGEVDLRAEGWSSWSQGNTSQQGCRLCRGQREMCQRRRAHGSFTQHQGGEWIVRGLNVSPAPNPYTEVRYPNFKDSIVNKVMKLNEIIRVDPYLVGLVLLKQEEPCTQREAEGRTQGEDSHLQAKERSLSRDQLCWHLDLKSQPPGLGEIRVCHLSRQPVGFC